MESSAAILPLSQLPSLFPQKPNRSKLYLTIVLGYPILNQEPLVPLACTATRCMSLDLENPRRKQRRPTTSTVSSLMLQLGLSALSLRAELQHEAHEELMEFLSRNSLNDGDQFCANLMRESSRHKGLGKSSYLFYLLLPMGIKRKVTPPFVFVDGG